MGQRSSLVTLSLFLTATVASLAAAGCAATPSNSNGTNGGGTTVTTGASGTIVLPNGSSGVAVVHIEDASGNLLTTPVLNNYPAAVPVTMVAEPPDFSQGLVGGGNTVQTFNTATTSPALAETVQPTTSGTITSLSVDADSSFAFVEMTSLTQYDTLCFTGGLHQTTGGSLQTGSQAYNAMISSNDGTVGVQVGSVGTQVWAFTPVASPHSLQTVDLTGNTYPFFSPTIMGRGGMALSSSNAILIGAGQALFAYTGASQNSYPSQYALVAVPNNATVTSIAFLPSGNSAVVATTAGFYLATVTAQAAGAKPVLTLSTTAVNPTYKGSDGNTYAMDHTQSVAITQDGKYLVALTDQPSATSGTLVVLPISTTGTIGAVSATVSGLLATAGVDSLFAH